jgi:hypothetical protein
MSIWSSTRDGLYMRGWGFVPHVQSIHLILHSEIVCALFTNFDLNIVPLRHIKHVVKVILVTQATTSEIMIFIRHVR